MVTDHEHPPTDDLTDDQRTLLRNAVREGYFRVPREVTLNDLAAAHGLSDREASERLRRGLARVARDVVEDDPGGQN
jgi:predicted DNA binding protein